MTSAASAPRSPASPGSSPTPNSCRPEVLYDVRLDLHYDYDGDYWYETCFTYTAFGGGLACDRAKAEVLAVSNCETHRTSLVIIGNISGRSNSIGVCTVTSCSQ